MQSDAIDELLEDSQTCDPGDPAGTIFEETLEDLNEMDRCLLLFSAGSNLVAVRWIFVLGANTNACDHHGTTALHSACRTGSLIIVKELLKQGVEIDICDSSGWSPLHIAVTMGRRAVVLYLLRSRANPLARTKNGKTPLDMCKDHWMHQALTSCIEHTRNNTGQTWKYEREHEVVQDGINMTWLRYEPFFVPRSPVFNATDIKQVKDLDTLGQRIFNKQPGQGLAFLVAAGCARDYPADLAYFLRRGKLNMMQIGNFLGDSFSLAQTLRLEFMNTVKFDGTNIITSLAKVFSHLHIPPDLQKIDRLVHTAALIWWRQHEKQPDEPTQQQDEKEGHDDEGELESHDLKQYLGCPETLYQLMFSVIMLHWNLYAPPSNYEEDERISMSEWIELNKGIEDDGGDVPTRILEWIYQTVRRGFIPQLAIRSQRPAGGDGQTEGLLKSLASFESWAWIHSNNFMNHSGALKCTAMPSIFSETIDSTYTMLSNRNTAGAGKVNAMVWNANGKDKVWISLCGLILIFSTSPSSNDVPFAFVHLRRVQLAKAESLNLLLVGEPEGRRADGEVANDGLESATTSARAEVETSVPVVMVFLLPDGRWQEIALPHLDMQVPSADLLEQWSEQLRAVCATPAQQCV